MQEQEPMQTPYISKAEVACSYAANGRVGSINDSIMERIVKAFGLGGQSGNYYQMPKLKSKLFKDGVKSQF